MAGSNFLKPGGVYRAGQSIILHPSFDRATLANDVGLLQVSSPFIWTNRVQPISLSPTLVGGGRVAMFYGYDVHLNR